MEKQLELWFVTILKASKVVLKKLKILKNKQKPKNKFPVKYESIRGQHYFSFIIEKGHDNKIPSIDGQLSFSMTAIRELEVRYNFDTLPAFTDVDSSLLAILENLCNENIENRKQLIRV